MRRAEKGRKTNIDKKSGEVSRQKKRGRERGEKKKVENKDDMKDKQIKQ
jgi:hypothetical protein